MPKAYWAAIPTFVVNAIYSGRATPNALARANRRDAVGASAGALEANFFGATLVAFAVAIVLILLLAIAFRLEKTAYRYASITLAIIVLIPRSAPAWIIGLHRLLEASVGIIVALAVVALWPEDQRSAGKSADEQRNFRHNIFQPGFFLIQGLSKAWERSPRCRNIKSAAGSHVVRLLREG